MMDTDWKGGKAKGAGIEAYVRVLFQGYKATTKWHRTRNPFWGEEFFIPLLLPSVGQLITIQVRDYDQLSRHDDVDVLTVRFDDVRRGLITHHRWWHLYGLTDEAEKVATSFFTAAKKGSRKVRRELKRQAEKYASTWRGKVLLSLSVHTPDESAKKPMPEKLLKMSAPKRDDPEVVEYALKAAVLMASDLQKPETDSVGTCCIEVEIEGHQFLSDPVQALQNGTANFLPNSGAGPPARCSASPPITQSCPIRCYSHA